ncbi:MAG TPA: hypothetical protein VGB50_05800 [Flavobacterium sp.]|jgi:hypothetical protein
MAKITFLFLLLSVSVLQAQETPRRILNGKITSALTELDGIYISNLQTDKTVASEKGGYFSIYAKQGDTLMFSAVQFKGKKVAVASSDFEKELLFVPMEAMITQLEEVKIIRYKNINAEALGIIPRGQKKYTPAERKLQTASGYMGIGPGASLDGVINAISGRTAMLKKEVKIERKEILLGKIEEMFESGFFTERLKIPQEYVSGFCFYIVENSKFASAVNNRNQTMATFLIGELAVEYLKLIENEK